ncbi:MAG: carbohydrate kinase [Phycisphaerales bacterium]|jgi:L-xylulokinase|nr:carbohydrate kinase [Phycisphaerales bacterium]MBT7170878.1 carbohydrate kinase [Phycisphaerales bacterium]
MTESNKYVLGLDAGGTKIKAGIFDLTGEMIAIARRDNPCTTPQAGWVEIDPDALWQAAAESIREAIATSGIDASVIVGVAPTGFGNGVFCVDADCNATRPAINSGDGRAKDIFAQWKEDGTYSKAHPHTLQAGFPGQTAAIVRWMADNEPGALDATRWLLYCKDFLRMKLTGEAITDTTDATIAGLASPQTSDWSDEALEIYGLSSVRDKLPPIRQPIDEAGKVTPAAADETGLAVGTPVFGGLLDADACAVSAGCVDESSVVLVVGSWGNNQYITPTPPISEDLFIVGNYAMDGFYYILEGSPTSASNFEWFVREFFEAEKAAGENPYALCDAMVADTPAESDVMFLPFLFGSNASLNATGTFLNLRAGATRGAMARAIFEGVCFSHCWHMDRLLQYRDKPASLRLTGGAANSAVWSQMFSDFFGLPLSIPGGGELGCLGASICAAVGAGEFDSIPAACDAMAKPGKTYEPDMARHALYQAKYQRYLKVLSAMEGPWDELK